MRRGRLSLRLAGEIGVSPTSSNGRRTDDLGGILPAVIYFFNVVDDAAALVLVSIFDKPQRDAPAMLFLRLHQQEIVGAEILW